MAQPAGLPAITWVGTTSGSATTTLAADLAAAAGRSGGCPLIVEQSRGSFRRPNLRGHRVETVPTGATPSGSGWSTAFEVDHVDIGSDRLVVDASDPVARLRLRTEVEALPGGPLRVRHRLTNAGDGSYLLEALDVCFPLPERHTEALDFTGRHERERVPQRHSITDGLWLRENRRGRTALESPTMIVSGTPGFTFQHGDAIALHVGFSGNSAHWVERDPAGPAFVGGGELLLPGEVTLGTGESYETPWVYVVAGTAGLDSVAAPLHAWQRSLPTHPARQPVLLNVWEAVYFDHNLARLTELADRAARIGVERFVLDDGWFLGRRDDTAGLGDWSEDPAVWPHGLHPLVDHVRRLGMEFGLWFEPEMINPDSELYRAHPDWILATGNRVPLPSRNQLVLDLTRPEVFDHLLERMDAVLRDYAVDFVKWDHNRDLLEAGSTPTGRPAGHRQALAHYALLDELRRRHPNVAWESCASGGGRIDLGVLPRVQRFWTSDMTDALARQQIQRWTAQLVAPEYLGAHVSATRSHQTGRTLSLDFRAATALFGSFGIEWDLTTASDAELDELGSWIERYKRFAPLLHGGRFFRADSTDPAVLLHGVVAADGRSALAAHVQLDESASNRGVRLAIPGLHDKLAYRLHWAGPVDDAHVSQAPPVHPDGPTAGVPVSGAVLGREGVWMPRRRPQTILLIEVRASAE